MIFSHIYQMLKILPYMQQFMIILYKFIVYDKFI